MRLFIRAALVALAVALMVPVSATDPILVTTAQAEAALLDINSAAVAQLEALKGVGPVRAAAIVKGRPYKRKDELVARKIIPQSVYDGIKDQVIARQ